MGILTLRLQWGKRCPPSILSMHFLLGSVVVFHGDTVLLPVSTVDILRSLESLYKSQGMSPSPSPPLTLVKEEKAAGDGQLMGLTMY
jgi:hypothetical protein